jgi:hypothetical protein
MGSSTVRCLLRLALCLLFALSFSSCEDSASEQESGKGTLGTHQFATEAHLKFLHP